jgi:hypothetical protein
MVCCRSFDLMYCFVQIDSIEETALKDMCLALNCPWRRERRDSLNCPAPVIVLPMSLHHKYRVGGREGKKVEVH